MPIKLPAPLPVSFPPITASPTPTVPTVPTAPEIEECIGIVAEKYCELIDMHMDKRVAQEIALELIPRICWYLVCLQLRWMDLAREISIDDQESYYVGVAGSSTKVRFTPSKIGSTSTGVYVGGSQYTTGELLVYSSTDHTTMSLTYRPQQYSASGTYGLAGTTRDVNHYELEG